MGCRSEKNNCCLNQTHHKLTLLYKVVASQQPPQPARPSQSPRSSLSQFHDQLHRTKRSAQVLATQFHDAIRLTDHYYRELHASQNALGEARAQNLEQCRQLHELHCRNAQSSQAYLALQTEFYRVKKELQDLSTCGQGIWTSESEDKEKRLPGDVTNDVEIDGPEGHCGIRGKSKSIGNERDRRGSRPTLRMICE